jgi:hypothetical protein
VRSLLRVIGNYIVTLQSEESRYEPTRFEGSDEASVLEVRSSCRDRIDAGRTLHNEACFPQCQRR